MADFTWKPDQKKALEYNDTMALVASAGTGKTTILVEKYTRNLLLLIDEFADEPEKALSRMAAITFTEAAAAEMKNRVRSRLRVELATASEKEDEERARKLHEVIKHFETAIIGTIHSFCRRILQENYLEAGISPGFQVLDEGIARQYQRSVVEEVVTTSLQELQLVHDFASRHGLSTFEDYIIQIADQLRADNKEHLGVEEMIRQQEDYWKAGVIKLAGELNDALALYMDHLVTARDSGKATEKHLEALLNCEKALPVLAPLLADPESILDATVPESLFDIHKIGVYLSGKAIEKDSYKIVYTHLRELLGSADGNELNLKNLAGIRKYAQPLIGEILTIAFRFIRRYGSFKQKQDVCDFDDLLLRTNHLLSNNKQVLQRYRDQFRWLFVDESQDVNEVQMNLIQNLYGEGKGGKLFMVGDGKQSIYKFRYADVQLFNKTVKRIESDTDHTFSLVSNFRSHQKFIASINAIFSNLFISDNSNDDIQMSYGEPMSAGRDEYQASETPLIDFIKLTEPKDSDGEPLKASEYNKKRIEGQQIARYIKYLRGKPNLTSTTSESIDFSDFAILLRSFNEITDYTIELGNAGIPYRVIEGKGFYQQREIWDLICYLKLIWFPEDDYAFLTVLRSPLCLISDETLLHLARNNRLNLNRLLNNPVLPEEIEPDQTDRLSDFLKLYRYFHNNRGSLSTAETLTKLLETTAYDAVTLCKEDGDQRGANIRKLLELARTFESTSNQSPLEFALTLEEGMFDDNDESQAPVFDEVDNHVKIMTVHRAKGLEFPVVILPNLNYSGMNSTEAVLYNKNAGLGVKVPAAGSYSNSSDGSIQICRDINKKLDLAEKIRVFYVAATRAKSVLAMSAWEQDFPKDGKKDFKVNSWLKLLVNIEAFSSENLDSFGINLITEPFKDDSQVSRHDNEDTVTKSATLSEARDWMSDLVTPISKGRKTMLMGVWQLIYTLYPQLNQVSDESFHDLLQEEDSDTVCAATIGTIVHNWLEKNLTHASVDTATVISDLLEMGMPESEVERASDAILGMLHSPLASELHSMKLFAERNFTSKLINNEALELTVNGVIDLLAVDESGDYMIIDYKYAASKNSREYEIQMMIYSQACKHYFGRLPGRAVIYYLKDGVAQEIDITESKQEQFLGFAQNQLTATGEISPR